jgi:hypothetical protein
MPRDFNTEHHNIKELIIFQVSHLSWQDFLIGCEATLSQTMNTTVELSTQGSFFWTSLVTKNCLTSARYLKHPEELRSSVDLTYLLNNGFILE